MVWSSNDTPVAINGMWKNIIAVKLFTESLSHACGFGICRRCTWGPITNSWWVFDRSYTISINFLMSARSTIPFPLVHLVQWFSHYIKHHLKWMWIWGFTITWQRRQRRISPRNNGGIRRTHRMIFAFRNGRQALLNETHDLVEFVEEDSAAGLEKFWLETANVWNPGGVP